MIEEYKNLDFEIVKEIIAKHCSFELSKKQILQSKPHFEYLYTNRMLERGKEAQRMFDQNGAPSFAGVTDIVDVLKDIHKGAMVELSNFLDVANVISAVQAIRKYAQNNNVKADNVIDLMNSLVEHKQVKQEIEATISYQLEVKDEASETLHSIRKNIQRCEGEISKKTSELMSKYASSLMDNISVARNGRTCLLVKISDKHKVKGFVHDESASGQAVYIEPEALLVLNNKLQSLKANEKAEIEKILKALSALIEPHTDAIEANLDTLVLLDTLFAKAKWAASMGAVYAQLEDAGDHLYFKSARHPLIDETKVVSNTYEIKKPYHHLLISGSNTGGKTVTLKTIGLFSIMTMSGFPITCEEAILSVFDQVYVDVGDAQSIVESLSTFSAHLSKLAVILKQATSKSLVLLDELGSGTDPNEGECLAISILEYLKNHKIMSVATTHYSKVKEYAKAQDEILLSSVGFNLDTMQPTYKYLSGFSGNSNALEIAKRCQIKDEVIAYASKLRDESYSDAEVLLAKLEADKLNLVEETEALEKEKTILRELQLKLDEKAEKNQIKYEQQVKEATRQAELIMEEARERANKVIDELRRMKSVKEHEIIKQVSKLKVVEDDEVEEELSETFMIGDYVSIKGLQYHGEIISMKGSKATILCNGMKMNVKVSELRKSLRPNVKKVASVSSKSVSSRPTMECNIIGMRVEEAIVIVEKYLDNAMYHKLHSVRIIHGSGTGALRKGIQTYLKQSKYVKDFRLGGEGEGGMGATVVTLRGKNNG